MAFSARSENQNWGFDSISSAWDRKFTTRREYAYAAEDNLVPSTMRPRVGQEELSSCDPITAYLKVGTSTGLDPPHFSHQFLEQFLRQANVDDLERHRYASEGTALLDDRKDDTVATNPTRDWSSDFWRAKPPPGKVLFNQITRTRELHDRLSQPRIPREYSRRDDETVERRILYIENVTPASALSLALNVAQRHAPHQRDFLQRHLTGSVYFGAVMTSTFVFEFHLPYFALRRCAGSGSDSRNLRKSRAFFRSNSNGTEKNGEYIHQAQTSLLITGADEWFWTVTCCTDTYFETAKPMQEWHETQKDAPTGGARKSHFPMWSPREYFLIALAARTRQARKEWENISSLGDQRLEEFVSLANLEIPLRILFAYRGQYDSILEEGDLEQSVRDEKDLRKTKQYSKIIHLLRLFIDALSRSIERWNAFRASQISLFRLASNYQTIEVWSNLHSEIQGEFDQLRFFKLCFVQSLERFENLKNGLVNASSLSESQVATEQGKDISLLTHVTVLYLPATLITSAYGMAMVQDDASWRLFGALVALLTACTFTIALRSHWKISEAVMQLLRYAAEPYHNRCRKIY